MNFSKKTHDLILKMIYLNTRTKIEFDQKKIIKLLQKANDVFKLGKTWDKVKIRTHLTKDYIESASSAWSASSASSASSARSAWSAWSASSDWSAWSAWSASSARSAVDYSWDDLVFGFEYNQEHKGNKNDKKFLDYMQLLLEAKEAGLGFRLEYNNTLYLVPAPVIRQINQQYHSDTQPAIEWETDKYYYLGGVNFSEKLWTKVVSGKMPFRNILKIKDIDQRTQAMRYGDIDAFMKHTKAKKLDSQIKVNSDGCITYSLYQIPVEPSQIFTETAYFVVYDCPSTGKKYMSGVEPCKTVAESMSWKFQITENEWREMVPLVHES
jgi:hypothetical protein